MPFPRDDSHFILFFGGVGSSATGGGPPEDTTPAAFAFTDVTDAALSTVYESNAIIVAGIDAPAAMTVVNGQYQKNGGAWASSATTAVLGDSIRVRGTSSDLNSTAVNVTLTIGGVSDVFTITTEALALAPPVNVVAPVVSGIERVAEQMDVSSGTWTGAPVITYTYQWMILGGTGAPVNVVAPAITGNLDVGQTLTVSTGTWTGDPTITYTYQWMEAVEDGSELVLEGTEMVGDPIPGATSPTYVIGAGLAGQRIFCEVTATNSVGSAMAQSNVTGAIASAADTTPDAFTFVDQTGVNPSTVIESAAITVSGITAATTLTVSGGEYQINGGAWASSATTVANGATVKVRATSSAIELTPVNVTLTVGGVSDIFTATTKAWDPSYLGSAALKLWIKIESDVYSDAGTTPVVDGDTVRQWNDLSGNANHLTQATSANRPPYGDDTLNSLPSVRIGGGDDRLETAFGLGTTTASCFLIGKAVAPNNNGRIVAFQAAADPNDFQFTNSGLILMGGAATTLQAYRAGLKSNGAVPTDGPIWVKSIFNGTTHTLTINGSAFASVASTGTFSGSGTLAIGASPGGGNNLGEFYLTELIITNNVLSAGDMTLMETYLQDRWEPYATPHITMVDAYHNAEGTVLAIPLTVNTQFSETVTWSIVGGADAADVEINGNNLLRWPANGVRDAAAPADANTDNIYNIVLRATGDTTGYFDEITLTVTVQDLTAAAPLDIVLDTDFTNDVDDAGALGIAIKAHIDGDCNLLAVISTSDCDSSAPAIRGILDHYGLTDVPVGAWQGPVVPTRYVESYTDEVRDRWNPGKHRTDYLESTTLYRMIAAAATRDFTIVTVGGLTGLSTFRQSAADVISADTGNTLITDNVAKCVIMGGNFPSGGTEYNLQRDSVSSEDIADNFPVPVFWHGAAVGNNVPCFPPISVDEFADPIRHAYKVEVGDGARPAWDPLAVLYAIYGEETNFDLGGENGTTTIFGVAETSWAATAGNDSYVIKIATPEALTAILNGILADLILP